MMTYIEMCLSGMASPGNWEKWLADTKDDTRPDAEKLGLAKEEHDDLVGKMRSMDFYVKKRGIPRALTHLWTGCYVRFLYEYDLKNPHLECGWVDIVNDERGFCKIQCDDGFDGGRAVVVRVGDVMEVLPLKERPLLYYKTMLCGECNGCDRMSSAEPPQDCRIYGLLNAINSKRSGDAKFISLYEGTLREKDKNSEN